MRLMRWLTGATTGSGAGTRPRPGVKLRLESCEQRAVPDGNSPTPPPDGGGTVQTAAQEQTYTFDVSAGEWLYAGQVNGQDQFFTIDGDGRQWLYSVDSSTGMYTAVLVNYDGSYDPAAGPNAETNFQPSAENWNLVWNPDEGTWSTAAPGAVFSGPVSGFTNGAWNYVMLQANNPPPPVNPPSPPAGSLTVTITVNGQQVTINVPQGGSVTITPAPGGGVTITNPPRPPRVIEIGPITPPIQGLPPPRVQEIRPGDLIPPQNVPTTPANPGPPQKIPPGQE